jgi:hypothetical protein
VTTDTLPHVSTDPRLDLPLDPDLIRRRIDEVDAEAVYLRRLLLAALHRVALTHREREGAGHAR